MEYKIQDFINESEKQQAFYNGQVSKLDTLLNDYKTKIDDLIQKKTTSQINITKILLPQFNREGLSTLAQLMNDKKLNDFYNQFMDEKSSLEKQITEIEANDDYMKRDALTDPQSGVLTSQISELKPLFQRANDTCQKILKFTAFKGLYERKYGTNLYPYKGFSKYFIPKYYQDWKNSDAMVESLQVNNFVDVLTLFQESESQVNAFSASIKDYEDQIKKIKSMEEEHDESSEKLISLEDIYFIKIGSVIIEYMKNLEKSKLLEFLTAHSGLEDEYKKYDGLEHQIEYLKQLHEKVIGERGKLIGKAGKLNEESMRYKMDSNKYRNKRFSSEQFNSRFSRDESKYDTLYDKYSGYGNTIYTYNDYYRASLLTDFLWWDMMTHGHIYGGFIPEVQQFHASNPEYNYSETDTGSANTDNS